MFEKVSILKQFPNKYSFTGIIIFALISTMVLCLSSSAQNNEAIPYRHHIELNIGEPFSSAWGLNLMFVDHSPAAEERFHSWAGTYRPYLGGPYRGYEDEWLSLPVTVAYYNQVLRWLQVGAEISTMSMCTTENTWEGKTYEYFLTTNLYLLGAVRFNYFHKGITDLYSGLSIGAKLRMETTKHDGVIAVTAGPAFQLTALGVRFGKRVYGSVELGYGYKGLLNVGVGTRF